jgi:CBS-domain-containing membrane protein
MATRKPRKQTKEGLIYKAKRDARKKHVLDEKLKEENMWIHYVLQSLLATFTLFVVIVIVRLQFPLIVAALGSTAFIVFAMPKNITAQPRNVVGGHFIGIISGLIFALIFLTIGNGDEIFQVFAASAAVGLSIFIMVATDTEHPPAGSTALAFVIHEGDLLAFIVVILVSAVIITVVKHILKAQLKDLV